MPSPPVPSPPAPKRVSPNAAGAIVSDGVSSGVAVHTPARRDGKGNAVDSAITLMDSDEETDIGEPKAKNGSFQLMTQQEDTPVETQMAVWSQPSESDKGDDSESEAASAPLF